MYRKLDEEKRWENRNHVATGYECYEARKLWAQSIDLQILAMGMIVSMWQANW